MYVAVSTISKTSTGPDGVTVATADTHTLYVKEEILSAVRFNSRGLISYI